METYIFLIYGNKTLKFLLLQLYENCSDARVSNSIILETSPAIIAFLLLLASNLYITVLKYI